MKLSKAVLITFVFVFFICFAIFLVLRLSERPKGVSAEDKSAKVDTLTDWQAGINTNTKLNDPEGTVKIDTAAPAQIDLVTIYNADNSRVTTNFTNCTTEALVNGISDFACSTSGPPGSTFYWTMNLGGSYTISQVKFIGFGDTHPEDTNFVFQISNNGSDFTTLFQPMDYTLPFDVTPTAASYVRIFGAYDDPFGSPDPAPTRGLSGQELEIYSPGYAINKTTIDGTTNFWSWDSFTPTQTVPANTSVTYRYRTSSTGSDWTGWTSNFASVTSRSGDTKYRYLQVEATLANTDGTSTPTIDQYDIDYHTEIKPSAPTAQTAAVQ